MKLGRRNSRIGVGRWTAGLKNDRAVMAAFMACRHYHYDVGITSTNVLRAGRSALQYTFKSIMFWKPKFTRRRAYSG